MRSRAKMTFIGGLKHDIQESNYYEGQKVEVLTYYAVNFCRDNSQCGKIKRSYMFRPCEYKVKYSVKSWF